MKNVELWLTWGTGPGDSPTEPAPKGNSLSHLWGFARAFLVQNPPGLLYCKSGDALINKPHLSGVLFVSPALAGPEEISLLKFRGPIWWRSFLFICFPALCQFPNLE